MGELEQGQPQKPPTMPGLHLMHIGRALVLVTSAAAVLLAVVIVGGLLLLRAEGMKAEPLVSAATLFDLLKIAFAVVAGLGGLVALVVAYRRQKVAEAAQHLAEQGEKRAHLAEQREAAKLHNDRFTTAAGQLGHDSPAVRLAGVHALAGLADDAPTRELRQTCIDVLCAYLRMPYKPAPGDASDEERLEFAGLCEVRHTIIRLITAHLRPDAMVSWQGHDLDFTGVVFEGGNFSGAIFSGGTVDFGGAIFSGGTVDFGGAIFSGGVVDFGGAIFSGGVVDFGGAAFSGSTVYFGYAAFSDGMVDFVHAAFSGGVVDFVRAAFSGSTVYFGGAAFSGGTVDFVRAAFSGGVVDFGGAIFSGGVVDFGGAAFSGGVVDFVHAIFSGGTVSYVGAAFSGGTVDLSRPQAWNVPPTGLPPNAPPEVLLLPTNTTSTGDGSGQPSGEPEKST